MTNPKATAAIAVGPTQESVYVMCVQYRGDQFNGWQRQIDQPTVQGHIEAALSQVAAHPIRIAEIGRASCRERV